MITSSREPRPEIEVSILGMTLRPITREVAIRMKLFKSEVITSADCTFDCEKLPSIIIMSTTAMSCNTSQPKVISLL